MGQVINLFKNFILNKTGNIQKRKGHIFPNGDVINPSKTIAILLKHWNNPLPDEDVITLPFNCENFCREMDELLKDNFAP